ncbi:fungal-specific transcription factor domain-containing protein [Aspergillus multicolor]|uniref:transcription factor domain-containing protein n=1 Tax=Aspergillus multicolor TaxID=41759 RepID=UPI003CCE1276
MFPNIPHQLGRGVKRRRVGVACNPCRAHKIRCDGVRPACGTCLRRREKCGYSDNDDGHSFNLGAGDGQDSYPLSPRIQQSTTAKDVFEPEVTAMGLAVRPLNDSHRSGSGEAFFGDSSAVTFIQRLQETLRPEGLAPELPQAYDTAQTPSNKRTGQYTEISLDMLPPRALADHLVDCYFSKIHILYPFVHKVAFLSLYQRIWMLGDNGSTSMNIGLGLGDSVVRRRTFYYGLNIIFAHGCQFSETMGAERQTTSEAFFRLSKPALDVDYLEHGDLALVQVLLLSSHYLQGSQTPNRCWHAIGSACRLAQGLGLHTNTGDEYRSFAQNQMRRRVWHGCRMLDLAASSMLGRPAMASQHSLVPLPEAVDDCYLVGDVACCEQPLGTFSRVEWFIATLKLHELLQKLQNTVYEDQMDHSALDAAVQKKMRIVRQVQSITQIDLELDNFRANIPQPLSWEATEVDKPGPFLRERCLLRARFLYLKLLAYRPALSQSLDRRPVQRTNSEDQIGTYETGIYANLILNCSVLCVQTALELIGLVHDTCSTDLASVWFYNVFYTFTAGIVLILAETNSAAVAAVTRNGLDAAWEQCQWILNYLKTYSIVAERCSHSLSDTRFKCLRMLGKTSSLRELTGLMSKDPDCWDQNAAQTGRDGAPNLDSDGAANEPLPNSFFDDLNLDNVALDWSWFDFSY